MEVPMPIIKKPKPINDYFPEDDLDESPDYNDYRCRKLFDDIDFDEDARFSSRFLDEAEFEETDDETYDEYRGFDEDDSIVDTALESEEEYEDVSEIANEMPLDANLSSKAFLNRDTCKNPLILACYHAIDDIPPLPIPSDVICDINVYSDTDKILEYIKTPGVDPRMKLWFESLVIAKNIRAIYYAVIRENVGWTSVCSIDDALSAGLQAVHNAINMYDVNYVNEYGQKTKFSTYMIKFVRNEVKKTHSKINTILKHERSLDVPLDTDEKNNSNAKRQVELVRDTRRNPEEELMSTEASKAVYAVLQHLDCMERFVMVHALGLTRTRNAMTQVQIGDYSGNSQANISKIKGDAETKLRKLREEHPEYLQLLLDAASTSAR